MKSFSILFLFLISNFFYSQKLTGVGYQKDVDESWKIDVNIKEKDNISVSYPTLGCSGKWILLKEDNKASLLKEVITVGEDKCIPENFIYLTKDALSPNSYRFYIYYKSEDASPYALGVLTKS